MVTRPRLWLKTTSEKGPHLSCMVFTEERVREALKKRLVEVLEKCWKGFREVLYRSVWRCWRESLLPIFVSHACFFFVGEQHIKSLDRLPCCHCGDVPVTDFR